MFMIFWLQLPCRFSFQKYRNRSFVVHTYTKITWIIIQVGYPKHFIIKSLNIIICFSSHVGIIYNIIFHAFKGIISLTRKNKIKMEIKNDAEEITVYVSTYQRIIYFFSYFLFFVAIKKVIKMVNSAILYLDTVRDLYVKQSYV